MKKQEITQAVGEALKGSHKVRVTFKREAAMEVIYLLGMVRGEIVEFDNSLDGLTMLAVASSRNWGGDRNRVVTLLLTDTFDEKWFVDRMYPALEKIEVVK